MRLDRNQEIGIMRMSNQTERRFFLRQLVGQKRIAFVDSALRSWVKALLVWLDAYQPRTQGFVHKLKG